jgi:hypothetical protein
VPINHRKAKKNQQIELMCTEITLAFEDDGPLVRGIGARRPENNFQQIKQFCAIL